MHEFESLGRQTGQRAKVSRIGKFVQHRDMERSVPHDVVDKVASNESGPAGDKDSLHGHSVTAEYGAAQRERTDRCAELFLLAVRVPGFIP
ncbi:hypothetical protein D3C86_2034330 [compost metagenome]